jgi:hypothetical protein
MAIVLTTDEGERWLFRDGEVVAPTTLGRAGTLRLSRATAAIDAYLYFDGEALHLASADPAAPARTLTGSTAVAIGEAWTTVEPPALVIVGGARLVLRREAELPAISGEGDRAPPREADETTEPGSRAAQAPVPSDDDETRTMALPMIARTKAAPPIVTAPPKRTVRNVAIGAILLAVATTIGAAILLLRPAPRPAPTVRVAALPSTVAAESAPPAPTQPSPPQPSPTQPSPTQPSPTSTIDDRIAARAQPSGTTKGGRKAPKPSTVQTSTLQRRAIDALVAGDRTTAAALYGELADTHPHLPAYRAAAEFLRGGPFPDHP